MHVNQTKIVNNLLHHMWNIQSNIAKEHISIVRLVLGCGVFASDNLWAFDLISCLASCN